MVKQLNPGLINLLVFVAGLTMFGAGLTLIWGPLGLIGVGLVLMLGSLLGGKKP